MELTKLEQVAAMAMQGFISTGNDLMIKDEGYTDGRKRRLTSKEIGILSISHAQELLGQIENIKP